MSGSEVRSRATPTAPYVPGETLSTIARDAALMRALHGGLDATRLRPVMSPGMTPSALIGTTKRPA